MRKIIIGSYDILESLIAILFFCLLTYFDFIYIQGVLEGGLLTEKLKFTFYYINLMCVFIIALPYLSNKAGKISDKKIIEFLNLPDKDERITFTTITGFLSNQALASFLVTALMFTGKTVAADYGGIIAAFYIVIFFTLASTVGSISLLQFIAYFTKYDWVWYGLAALLSSAVMLMFVYLGIILVG